MKIILPLTLALAACSPPTVLSTPNSCASLIPASWRQGVAAPDLPADDSIGSWIVFGDSAIGKLDIANSRTRDVMDIQAACEARDAAAVKKATRRRVFGIAI